MNGSELINAIIATTRLPEDEPYYSFHLQGAFQDYIVNVEKRYSSVIYNVGRDLHGHKLPKCYYDWAAFYVFDECNGLQIISENNKLLVSEAKTIDPCACKKHCNYINCNSISEPKIYTESLTINGTQYTRTIETYVNDGYLIHKVTEPVTQDGVIKMITRVEIEDQLDLDQSGCVMDTPKNTESLCKVAGFVSVGCHCKTKYCEGNSLISDNPHGSFYVKEETGEIIFSPELRNKRVYLEYYENYYYEDFIIPPFAYDFLLREVIRRTYEFVPEKKSVFLDTMFYNKLRHARLKLNSKGFNLLDYYKSLYRTKYNYNAKFTPARLSSHLG